MSLSSVGDRGGVGRGGGVAFLQVLLAMLFLAIIGGTVGYLAGEQHNKAKKSSSAGSGSTSTAGSKAAQNSGGGSGSSAGSQRCPAHTEGLAGGIQLTVVIHLHTTVGTDVWICKATDGTLFYQGRKAKSGTDFQEGVNALFLRDVSYEGGEYVARNYDSGNGSTTEYHVTEGRLVQVYRNYPSPKPDSTEYAG